MSPENSPQDAREDTTVKHSLESRKLASSHHSHTSHPNGKVFSGRLVSETFFSKVKTFFVGNNDQRYQVPEVRLSEKRVVEGQETILLQRTAAVREEEIKFIEKVRTDFHSKNHDVSNRIIKLNLNGYSLDDIVRDLRTETIARPITQTEKYRLVANLVANKLEEEAKVLNEESAELLGSKE